MKCEMKKDVLERWLDDELDGEAAVHVDFHVKECCVCSQHVAQTLQVRQALRDYQNHLYVRKKGMFRSA